MSSYRRTSVVSSRYFIKPPELLFTSQQLEGWHASIQERFGPHAHLAYAVYNSLKKHGIYYVDLRPSNVNLDGLPGLEPLGSSDDDL